MIKKKTYTVNPMLRFPLFTRRNRTKNVSKHLFPVYAYSALLPPYPLPPPRVTLNYIPINKLDYLVRYRKFEKKKHVLHRAAVICKKILKSLDINRITRR